MKYRPFLHMPKAYIIARRATSYRRYITRSERNGYHSKRPHLSATNVVFLLKTNPNFNTNAPPFEVRGCKVILGGAFLSQGGAIKATCPLDASCTNLLTTFRFLIRSRFYLSLHDNEFLAMLFFLRFGHSS